MKNIKLLLLLGAFILCIQNSFSQKEYPLMRFGLIADIQYADSEDRGTRYYRNSLEKLENCILDLNDTEVDFTINLGDAIDNDPQDLDTVIALLDGLDSPLYSITGNHDYAKNTSNSELYEQLNMPDEYYAFVKEDWCFIMLNTNEISSYANEKVEEKEKELEAMLQNIKLRNRNNGQNWNGGISGTQLEWLEQILSIVEQRKQKALIFTHHPIYPASGYTALNDQEILELIALFPCVKAVISGHNHAGDFAHYQSTPYITTEGMIETEKENAYGVVDIFQDRIEIKGRGRTSSYTLPY